MFTLEHWYMGTTQEPKEPRLYSWNQTTLDDWYRWVAECQDRARYGCKVEIIDKVSFIFTTSNDSVVKFILTGEV
ncbi:hypothetical protein PBI_GRAYSON_278 [Rhodococcus phage Grayson]|nr:hypothetical protein PBI_GRAYSON_278 [Rhodococcus phage Grayson]